MFADDYTDPDYYEILVATPSGMAVMFDMTAAGFGYDYRSGQSLSLPVMDDPTLEDYNVQEVSN